jgi:hypothetical protein
MRPRLLAFAFAALALACGGHHDDPVACEQLDGAAVDETLVGCHVQMTGQLCEQPGSCKPICASSQYQMACRGAATPPLTAPLPTPDPSLGCEVIGIPTPSGVLFYCCPCGH